MGIITKDHNDERHYNAMVNYVERGKYYGALSNDGKCVVINGETPNGYPSGYSVLNILKEDIPSLIACLQASLQLRS